MLVILLQIKSFLMHRGIVQGQRKLSMPGEANDSYVTNNIKNSNQLVTTEKVLSADTVR